MRTASPGVGPVVAVVQARMGSSRFPGKMLARLGDHTLLEWVLRRVLRARCVDQVVLATSVRPENDALEQAARGLGVSVVRGAEHDVLSRFVTAARDAGAAWIVRVCADNPFVDAAEIDRLVSFATAECPDYAFNHLNRLDNGYADGFGAEILTADTLRALDTEVVDPASREHVTMAIWQQPDRYRIRTFPAPPELAYPEVHFDIDTPADLMRLTPLATLGLGAAAREFVAAERRLATVARQT